jgi:integrase
MPKRNPELNALQVKRLPSGTHFVGGVGGLTLQVGDRTPGNHQPPASWILRVYVAGVRRNTGLGSYPEISLAQARERAKAIKDQAKIGVDPIRQKAAQRTAARQELAKAKTFKDCAEAYMATHASDYKNAKHAKQWVSTIRNDAYPLIGNILVQDLSLDDMLAVLKPIWTEKTETAKRLRGRIERVIDFAISSGYRDGSNPARWKGYLSLQLPSPSRIAPTKHFESLPYRMMPGFMAALRKRDGSTARALEFLIHTATRSGSVRLATWAEIDLKERLWNIPAAHTKTTKPHRVPLSEAALEILKRQPRTLGSDLLFPSIRGKVISDMAMLSVMRRMRADEDLIVEAVPHGFRSTFKVWATEQTDYPSEMTEICLMHSVGDAVYEAYQRSDMFQKRRAVMSDWSEYIQSPASKSKVTPTSRKHP